MIIIYCTTVSIITNLEVMISTSDTHATGLDGSGVENPSNSTRTLNLRMLPMTRGSAEKAMLVVTIVDLYDLVGSDPLPALYPALPPPPVGQFRKAHSLPSSDSDVPWMSSDDDSYIGPDRFLPFWSV